LAPLDGFSSGSELTAEMNSESTGKGDAKKGTRRPNEHLSDCAVYDV